MTIRAFRDWDHSPISVESKPTRGGCLTRLCHADPPTSLVEPPASGSSAWPESRINTCGPCQSRPFAERDADGPGAFRIQSVVSVRNSDLIGPSAPERNTSSLGYLRLQH